MRLSIRIGGFDDSESSGLAVNAVNVLFIFESTEVTHDSVGTFKFEVLLYLSDTGPVTSICKMILNKFQNALLS